MIRLCAASLASVRSVSLWPPSTCVVSLFPPSIPVGSCALCSGSFRGAWSIPRLFADDPHGRLAFGRLHSGWNGFTQLFPLRTVPRIICLSARITVVMRLQGCHCRLRQPGRSPRCVLNAQSFRSSHLDWCLGNRLRRGLRAIRSSIELRGIALQASACAAPLMP